MLSKFDEEMATQLVVAQCINDATGTKARGAVEQQSRGTHHIWGDQGRKFA